MPFILAILNGLLDKLTAFFVPFWFGKTSERLDNTEKVLENVKKSNSIADDDDYDDSLRDKYGR